MDGWVEGEDVMERERSKASVINSAHPRTGWEKVLGGDLITGENNGEVLQNINQCI